MYAYLKNNKESLLSTIIQGTSDIVYLNDINGRIVFVNDAYKRAFGVEIEDVIGKSALELYGDEKIAGIIEETNKKVKETGKTVVTEEIAQTKNGLRTFLVTKSPWKDDSKNVIGVVCVAHDITERKQMELALAASESNFRSIFEHSPIGIAVADSEGIILHSNPAFERMLGYDDDELHGMVFTQFTHPEDIDREMPFVNKMVEGKCDSYEIEKRYIRKDGKVIWVRLIVITFHGACGEHLALAMAEDITERKQADEQLRRSEYLLSTIFSGIDDHMYLKDNNSRIIMANSAVGNDIGVPVKELIGKTELEFFTDKNLAAAVLDNDRYVMESQKTQVVEEDVVLKDGIHTFLSKKVPWLDEQGNVIGIFGISRDITEVKRSLEKIKESEERALRLVKELEEVSKYKSEFLSALSHELRNPLAAISAGLQLMDATSDESHIKSAKQIMRRQLDQICRLVDDLLDLMRISNNKIELKKEHIELNGLAQLSVKDFKPMFDQKGIKLQLQKYKEEIYIDADPVRIKQITGNLLHNALKFTQEGGTVTLSVSRQKDYAVICAKDTGIGIAPKDIPKLFKPFSQIDKDIDRRLGGIGLGLAIVKAIAQLHGGSASAFSEGPGKGSSFVIRLPTSSAKEVHIPEEEQIEEYAEKLRLLIIEDNKDYCDMISAMLDSLGYETESAPDGKTGILKASKCVPDAIICDIGLPGISGYEVAKTLKSQPSTAGVLLIALTGYAGRDDIIAAKEAGFDYHIAKPVNIGYLRSVLNKASRAKKPA